ncbi:hypothetical protein [Massilia pseudoviolaceinigra]|uniref:hypothetical protein n=1 Tax=Massilia pseudoviolaceinigra TaxID=3057165 RepID=UPI00279671F9|nr:hypothetical protein [Massilia sp. CCM 9206]MDQ1922047.1 hypothetical protein [Massilia sp. CCM 9206]
MTILKNACVFVASLFFCGAANATTPLALPTIPAGEAVSSPLCEFIVRSPVRVELKGEYGSQGLFAESEPDSPRAVFVRAECGAIADQAQSVAGLRSLAEQHVQASRLEQATTSIQQTELGAVASYSGMKKLAPGGGRARFSGRMIVGKSSLLHIVAIESGERPASKPVTLFLASVHIKSASELANPVGQRLTQLAVSQGTVLRQRVRMNAILDHCQSQMPDLAPGIAEARASWEGRNKEILDKLALLTATTMREAYGERQHLETATQLQNALDFVTRRDVAAMASAPLTRQRCEASMESVRSGRSDLLLLSKDASEFIMRFQP